eukprot:CAMPEP_0179204072 /NCGR_PEP_ID=MMETSP0796-20121207/101730_1 /TAXON_ID=73915 /ORGANISM="Pyrodinium bahamense, Strain pbaha01" /LENGTH=484 /DNA_ID=CAMNT_0020908949 /DNA_START=36 /DNA_END=1492 /DNA_ORIENTATION=-
MHFCHLEEHNLLWFTIAPGKVISDQAVAAAVPQAIDVGMVLWPEQMESAAFLTLSIPFFRAEQLGAAAEFGPMSLDTILNFAAELKQALAKVRDTDVVCVGCSGRRGAVLNSLLLIGAFLLLERQMGAADVMRRLFVPTTGISAHDLRFPTPWMKNPAWTPDSLTISDCFFGLEAALQHGWLDFADVSLGARRWTALSYDAVPVCRVTTPVDRFPPLEPQQATMTVWVAADPVTTVVDPSNRATPPMPPSSPAHSASCYSAKSSGVRDAQLGLSVKGPQEVHPQEEWHARSPAEGTLAKLRSMSSLDQRRPTPGKVLGVEDEFMQRPQDLQAFARWLKGKACCCQLLVRANKSDERGLPGGSYGDFFEHWGVPQLEAPFPDGTAPPNKVVVEEVLHRVTAVVDGLQANAEPAAASVVVHCKSGLGRSMSLVGAIAVSFTPGLRGAAYFGWARLVRPGAIQSLVQERFLRALDEKSAGCSCCRGL